MKLAIVHDFLNQYGGAERAVGYLADIFPEAPIYTSIFFQQSTYDFFKNKTISTSFMQKIPGINRNYRKFFFLYPHAFRSFDLEAYDIILTSSSSFSNFTSKGKDSQMISYCYTPARFLWESEKYLNREHIPGWAKLLIKPIINNLKKKDLEAAKKVDYFIAISNHVREKIKNIYNRDSIVIYPPIEMDKYKFSAEKEDFYLVVSRLKSYKRVDLAVKAFNKLSKKLVVVGTGEEELYLKKIAGKNIEFTGRISDNKLLELYSKAKALLFTGEEDFGLTPLEAQASGTPVIAYNGGGALETIIEGKTGFFFEHFNQDSLIDGIKLFEKNKINPEKCRKNASKFDLKYFKKQIVDFIGKISDKKTDSI